MPEPQSPRSPQRTIALKKVDVLDSGVVIQTIRMGDGKNFPELGQTVRIEYEIRISKNQDEQVGFGDTIATFSQGAPSLESSMSIKVYSDDHPPFESSRTRGSPYDFRIGAGIVLPSVEEAIMKLSRGQRAIIVVPPNRAYGMKGIPPIIPPNSTLEYDVELIAMQ